jgi:hypothetical protein
MKPVKHKGLPDYIRKIIVDEVRSQIGLIGEYMSELHSQTHHHQVGTSGYCNTMQGAMTALFRDRDLDEISSALNN